MAAKEPASRHPEKKKFLKMPHRTTKNKKIKRGTVATGHSRHGHDGQESTGYNSTLPKVAVHAS